MSKADIIIGQTLGQEIESVIDDPNASIEDDDQRPVLTGQAVMTILPLNPIE